MELIKADHSRTLQLAGVPEPVCRPVDIDQAQTGFAVLRSLRIYRFLDGSVIDGHAESDEVLIVVLTGSVKLTMTEHDDDKAALRVSLSSVSNSTGEACVAYLPPGGAYRLVPQEDADVAYARATPSATRAPAVFAGNCRPDTPEGDVLFEESSYPAHLRLRILQLSAALDGCSIVPVRAAESMSEALVYVRTEAAEGAVSMSVPGRKAISIESWDTVSVYPGERPTLHVAAASSALILVVLASA